MAGIWSVTRLYTTCFFNFLRHGSNELNKPSPKQNQKTSPDYTTKSNVLFNYDCCVKIRFQSTQITKIKPYQTQVYIYIVAKLLPSWIRFRSFSVTDYHTHSLQEGCKDTLPQPVTPGKHSFPRECPLTLPRFGWSCGDICASTPQFLEPIQSKKKSKEGNKKSNVF